MSGSELLIAPHHFDLRQLRTSRAIVRSLAK